mmetsp:Transcript_58826/g.154704  ORF Transcript_58826/g.154704 Transcript_58826/m.154704 type:complete len:81 (+) Transcript_58826:163-405(+)
MIAPPSPDDEFTMELLRVILKVPLSIAMPPPYCADEQLIIDEFDTVTRAVGCWREKAPPMDVAVELTMAQPSDTIASVSP